MAMELKEAIEKVREGKVVYDDSKGMKYFLFMWQHDKMYLVHATTINEDKKRIAVLENATPNLLAKNWWKRKWEVYDELIKSKSAKPVQD